MYNYKITVDYDVNGDDDINYQKCFLSAMNLQSYDGEKIMEVFDTLLKETENSVYFKDLFKKQYNIPYIGSNKVDMFPLFFSYQSFIYMHRCLQSYYSKKTVSKEDMEDLDKSLDYLLKK